MNIFLIQDVVFDDEATRLMGIALDRACTSLPQYSGHFAVREIIAKRIVACRQKWRGRKSNSASPIGTETVPHRAVHANASCRRRPRC